MPVHDWTKVTAGTFHAFHNSWITHIQESLNAGLLPSGYYALGEQRSGDIGPDVLTLHSDPDESGSADWTPSSAHENSGMIAIAEQPPKASMEMEATHDAAFYLQKRRTLVIYHSSGDRIVALIEIVSPGNKHSSVTVSDFMDKVIGAINHGYHLMVIDLFPPGRHDTGGMNSQIWECIDDQLLQLPDDRRLSVASYCAKAPITAWCEPLAVGAALNDMPLCLTPDHYIYIPLEETYMAAWRGIPQRWRQVIEG